MSDSPYIRSANPGSHAALDGGCTCPVEDNQHGAGFMVGGQTCYYITQGCRLHGCFADTDELTDMEKA